MLAPQALHYQQEGSNDGFQHKPEIEKNPPQFLTRWVITCRETLYLQETGYKELKRLQPDVVKVGLDAEYTVQMAWNPSPDSADTDIITAYGEGDEEKDTQSNPATATDQAADKTKKAGTKKVRRRRGGGGGGGGLIADPNPAIQHSLRQLTSWAALPKESDWPCPPRECTVSSPHTLLEALCCSVAVPILNEYKCTVTAHIPHSSGTMRAIPQAPLWDHNPNSQSRPYRRGHMFDAAKLAHSFGLKYSSEHNGCWKQDILELNAYIAYQPYKQQLPTPDDLEGGLSKDIKRILDGRDPIGFWFTGSGGNAVGCGNHGAVGKKKYMSPREATGLSQTWQPTREATR
jgi:hypothetical protein